MPRISIRALVSVATALIAFCILPAVARAEGVLYVAHDPEGAARTFPLAHTDVRSEVAGEIVSTQVTQRFKNPYAERIEVVYVFPLPNHAAVDDMQMVIGSRTVHADVKRRVEAQATYDAATRRGQHAALLEQERPNIFTFSVANIDPGGEIEVRLHYFEIAKYDHGTYEMTFPMVVGPRYIPGTPTGGLPAGTGTRADTDRVKDASRISPAYVPPGMRTGNAIALSVDLDAGSPIESIESPVHDVTTTRKSATRAVIALRDVAEIPNRDFILRWKLAAPTLETAVFMHRADASNDGYLAVLLEPKHETRPEEIAPRELFFLLDTSGSMKGRPLDAAIGAVRRALGAMQPSDTFQIIDFADTASTFAPRPLANTANNVRKANDYLSALVGSGGTNQLAGIHASLSAPGDATRTRYVVFMTDGYIGNEAEIVRLVRAEIGKARIFGFGVGNSVNRHLLDEVSLIGRGASEYLGTDEDPRVMIERFYERIGRPYLTDVELEWDTHAVSGVKDMYPSQVPDVSALSPLVVFARYQGSGPTKLTVRGRLAGRPFKQEVSVTLPAQENANIAISRVWAREKIGWLTRLEARPGESEEEITRTALAHHLVTSYTSLVAIDDSRPTGASGFPMLVNQPQEAPEGVNMGSAGAQYAAAPPPAPQDSMSYEVSRKRGGCAGCATTASKPTRAELWFGGALALLALLRLSRRLRKKEA